MNNAYDTVKGLVLRQRDFKDTDKMLTVLTEKGKLSLLVTGARRKGSRMRSCCEPMSYNEFTVYEYRDWLYVNEAESLDPFTGLHNDLDKLFLGSYFCELLENISDADSADPALMQLALNSCYALSHLNTDKRIVKAAFELRLMGLAGFMPSLDECPCGSGECEYFSLRKGTVFCPSCAQNENCVQLPPPVLAAMRHICYGPPKRLFSFTLEEAGLRLLASLAQDYVLTQLERGFSTLDMYNSIQI